MHQGRLHSRGSMREVLTDAVIQEVFEVRARVSVDDRMRVNWSRS